MNLLPCSPPRLWLPVLLVLAPVATLGCDAPSLGMLATPAEASEPAEIADPLLEFLRAPLPVRAGPGSGPRGPEGGFREPDSGCGPRARLAAVQTTLPAVADWLPLFEAELLAKAGDVEGVQRALDRLTHDTGIRERWGAPTLMQAVETTRGAVPGMHGWMPWKRWPGPLPMTGAGLPSWSGWPRGSNPRREGGLAPSGSRRWGRPRDRGARWPRPGPWHPAWRWTVIPTSSDRWQRSWNATTGGPPRSPSAGPFWQGGWARLRNRKTGWRWPRPGGVGGRNRGPGDAAWGGGNRGPGRGRGPGPRPLRRGSAGGGAHRPAGPRRCPSHP
jgi:hypothetical protein